MASVSSLDKDLRNLRMSKYSAEATNEVRDWIEDALGEKLAAGDLLDALKDGTILCKLISLAVPPGPKFKSSSMPFIQMENISHFLKACQSPPLGMHPHDVFLTVDLFERKDPAQVIQCIVAFSRRANVVQPDRFPNTIGPKTRRSVGGTSSPQRWGSHSTASTGRERVVSNTSMGSTSTFNAGSRLGYGGSEVDTPGSSPGSKSNGGSATKVKGGWNKNIDGEGAAPAWNIHQYGYMGGASQGNQGITFGGRRQITSPAPKIPSLAEKDKKRKEELAEQERREREIQEAEECARRERDVEEARERAAEAKRLEEETNKLREAEKRATEDESRRRATEDRLRREADIREIRERDERRKNELRDAESNKQPTDGIPKGAENEFRQHLHGQFLSDYQAEERHRSMVASNTDTIIDARILAERERVRQLEQELDRARERERQYEGVRQGHARVAQAKRRSHIEDHDRDERTKREGSISPVRKERRPSISSHRLSETSWQAKERDYLRREWDNHHDEPFGTTSPAVDDNRNHSLFPSQPSSPTHTSHPQQSYTPGSPTRNRPPRDSLDTDYTESNPTSTFTSPINHLHTTRALLAPELSPVRVKTNNTGPSSRPLPDPTAYASTSSNRIDHFLASHPAPVPEKPKAHLPSEFTFDSSAERDMEDARRVASQTKTQAGGWASKSLLEREMEKERERQREWEEGQMASQIAAQRPIGQQEDSTIAGRGRDAPQYGDDQNRPGAAPAGRRQIIGPRPPP